MRVIAVFIALAAVAACSISAVSVSSGAVAPTPVVQTASGPVFGFVNEFGSYSFRGIPYAAPPVGDLRFAPPIPPKPWTTARNATDFGAGCYSECRGKLAELMCAKVVSEDCLYLNIYTPTLNASAKLPVVLFIHGGMFSWGAGGIPLYDGARWAQEQNIIIITINYRLNIFGGLATSTVKGNFQILDQRQSLIWVQQSIAAFGGDPQRVTVSGESAGATSVGVHLVSPKSWPYFQRAAVISDPYGLIPPSRKMALELGEVVLIKLGCPIGGAAELACLRNKTTEEIFKMAKTDFLPAPDEVLSMFMQWSPYVDGDEIPLQPIVAMQQGKFSPVPLYIGTVANETIPFIFGIDFDVPVWLMDLALDYVFSITDAAQIEALYGPVPPKSSNDTRAFFSRIFTDFSFYCPSRYVARLASAKNNNNTYMYLFDSHPSWAIWYANGNANAPCVEYICHAFDLPALFATTYVLPSTAPRPTPAEDAMSKFVQTAVAQFAASGTITANNWPRYTAATQTAYNISTPIDTTAPLAKYREKFCDYFETIGWNRW